MYVRRSKSLQTVKPKRALVKFLIILMDTTLSLFQPESCPEADSSMSQDRRASFGYPCRRSKSMERKDSVRRRSWDNETNDDSGLTVEKGKRFFDIHTLQLTPLLSIE